jgi:hypothetical protein
MRKLLVVWLGSGSPHLEVVIFAGLLLQQPEIRDGANLPHPDHNPTAPLRNGTTSQCRTLKP